MGNSDINRLDLNILMILAKEEATDELNGMTVNEINSYYGEDKPPLSARPNLCKRIRGLCSLKYIEEGIKDVISNTYFITESGLKRIKWNGGKRMNNTINKSLINDVAVVGVGGAGTNIAFNFEKLGYTTIHINSSTQDESAISGAKTIRHLKGFNGCAGNRQLAEQAIAKNMDIIDEISALKESIIYIIFSSAGGTGSGVAPALAEMLAEETDKTICCIVVLPDKTEDYDFHVNSYKCCQELLNIEGLGSVMFLDNNADNKQNINKHSANMLHAFLTNNSVSEYGNVDEQEKRTMIATSGNFILSVLKADKVSDASVIERLTTKNIFAPLQKDNRCEYIGIINATGKRINKAEIINIVGTPIRTFEGFGSTNAITVIAGLSYPFDHINSIKDIAKQKHDERENAIKAAPTMTLDDIDFGEKKVSKNVEADKKANKKPSRRDRLKELQS